MNTGINNSVCPAITDGFPAIRRKFAMHSPTQFAARCKNANACLFKRLLAFLLGFVMHIAVLSPVDNFSPMSPSFPQALISECAFFSPLLLTHVFCVSEHWVRFFALEYGICSALLCLIQFSVDSLQSSVLTALLTILRAAALLTVDTTRALRPNVIHRLRSLFWLIVLCLLSASLKYAAMK